jgi:hypothetical protein
MPTKNRKGRNAGTYVCIEGSTRVAPWCGVWRAIRQPTFLPRSRNKHALRVFHI